MRLGVLIPSFAPTPDRAIAATIEAERAGIHGAFAYCHLWPMGYPGRPAISPYPLLGMLAGLTERIAIGTLVARVGLESETALLGELLGLHSVAPGRFIAGIGTGDRKSAAENVAYGVPFEPARERREKLRHLAAVLTSSGVTTWIGGGAPATNEIARSFGCALNLWDGSVAQLAAARSSGPVTWGGLLPKDPDEANRHLRALRRAGVTWAVFTWPGSVEPLLAAATAAQVPLDG
jgi:alkanesulfonate monooxygenase SsuD/methylene tetrahydromethanopterin reductase-like flavin-dependent oxidoreductase (luciferase family)